MKRLDEEIDEINDDDQIHTDDKFILIDQKRKEIEEIKNNEVAEITKKINKFRKLAAVENKDTNENRLEKFDKILNTQI